MKEEECEKKVFNSVEQKQFRRNRSLTFFFKKRRRIISSSSCDDGDGPSGKRRRISTSSASESHIFSDVVENNVNDFFMFQIVSDGCKNNFN